MFLIPSVSSLKIGTLPQGLLAKLARVLAGSCEFIYNREEIFFYGHVIGSYVTKFTAHSSTSHPHTNALSNLLEDSFPLLTTSHWQTWLSTVDTETKSVQLLRQKDLEIYLKSLFLQLRRLDKRWWSKEREEGVETWGREEALASP